MVVNMITYTEEKYVSDEKEPKLIHYEYTWQQILY